MTFKLALKHLFSKPVSSLLTLLAVSAALTLLGSFWTIVENLERVRVTQIDISENGAQPGITVFVDSKLAANEITSLKKKFLDDKRFKSTELVAPEEAMKILEAQFGETLTKVFSAEALPITLKLQFAISTLGREEFLTLLNEIRSLPGVLDVDAGQGLSAQASPMGETPVFSWATLLLIAVFLIVALLVSHLIRIAFESLRPEVETLKVLGASKFWIFKPLLVEGIFFGVSGAIVSLLLLALSVNLVLPRFSELLLPKGFEMLGLSPSASLGLMGVSLGASLFGAIFTWPLIERPAQEI